METRIQRSPLLDAIAVMLQYIIQKAILTCHSFRGEPGLKDRAHLLPVQFAQATDGLHSLLLPVDDETCDAVINDFRN